MTIFLINVKVGEVEYVADMIAHYLLELYKTDKKMIKALKNMFKIYTLTCFDRLKDKSAISTLNATQRDFAGDGYHFYDFVSDGILHTVQINYRVNFDWLFTMKIDAKTEYFYPGEKFREIVVDRFGN